VLELKLHHMLTHLASSSVVIDKLIMRHGEANVAYLYCDYRDQTSQTVVNILGSVLRQFLTTACYVPETIITTLESIKKKGQRVEIEDISKMLKVLVPHLHRSFLCLDALDELESHTRFTLLQALRTEFGNARIFLTGRPHIEPEVNRALQTQLDAMHIEANEGDIRGFLIYEIEKDMNINPDDMNEQLREEILEAIISKADGMYVLHFFTYIFFLEVYTPTQPEAIRRVVFYILHGVGFYQISG